jgi:diadenosine tetraphosphate (Ap4A) HIT family hydrolase
MDDVFFCKIAAGAIPSKKAYEDDWVLAFYDINPGAGACARYSKETLNSMWFLLGG